MAHLMNTERWNQYNTTSALEIELLSKKYQKEEEDDV